MVNVNHGKYDRCKSEACGKKKIFSFLCVFKLPVSWVMLDQLAQRKSPDFATLHRIGTYVFAKNGRF